MSRMYVWDKILKLEVYFIAVSETQIVKGLPHTTGSAGGHEFVDFTLFYSGGIPKAFSIV